jgi:molybdopterin converting factor small subunit
MELYIKGYLTFRKTIGKQVFMLGDNEKVTLKDLLVKLSLVAEGKVDQTSAESLFLEKEMIILINGRNVSQLPHHLDTMLIDQDKIDIFPPMVGG